MGKRQNTDPDLRDKIQDEPCLVELLHEMSIVGNPEIKFGKHLRTPTPKTSNIKVVQNGQEYKNQIKFIILTKRSENNERSKRSGDQIRTYIRQETVK